MSTVAGAIAVRAPRVNEPAKSYMTRRKSEGKTIRAARRCHKRQLANVIIRHMWNDANLPAPADPPASTAAA